MYQSGRDISDQQPNNPLHGITLEMILTQLVEHYGWDEMGRIIKTKNLWFNPTVFRE